MKANVVLFYHGKWKRDFQRKAENELLTNIKSFNYLTKTQMNDNTD